MAKRRKVGNMLALAVLAAVTERPMYPYEMASVLRERDKDRDMKIKWGSLYTVVQNLERHGLLEAAESMRQGGRPERTVYRITAAGRAELVDWARELVSVPERERPKFEAGLSVLGMLPPDEVADLLRRRLERLDTEIAAQRAALTQHRQQVHRLFLIEAEYDLAIRDAEVSWIRALVDELASGQFPDLALWSAWHGTSQLSPDAARNLERGTSKD